jgi:hypothetical protein
MVLGHQRTPLSGLIPVTYHLFSERQVHHFISARPKKNQLGLISIFCNFGL